MRWLRLGWNDFRRAPGLSLLFGAVIVVVSMAVSALAWWLGRFALLATLLSGFVFVAPMLAVGLYCVSRSLEHGESPSLRCSFMLARRVAGQAGVYALAQGRVDSLVTETMLRELTLLTPAERQAYLNAMPWGRGGAGPGEGRLGRHGPRGRAATGAQSR